MKIGKDVFITVAEAAEHYKITRQQMYWRMRKAELPRYRLQMPNNCKAKWYLKKADKDNAQNTLVLIDEGATDGNNSFCG